MQSVVFVVMITGVATLWAMAGRGTGSVQQPSTGRDVYVNKGCHYCHGYEGQGSMRTGPRVAPAPVPIDDFTNFVRRPPNVMPAYPTELLSDEELDRIYEYLESIPEPPDVESIPAFAETPDP